MMRFHATRVLSLAALFSLTGCTGDEDAPDCFFPDGMGGCLVPPIIDINLSCDDIPSWAVSAQLNYLPMLTGGTGTCDAAGCNGYTFAASGLPDGVIIDENSGLITGAPTEEGNFDITITVSDQEVVGSGEASCTLDVGPALNVDRLRDEPKHCLDIEAGMSVEDFLDDGVRDENDAPVGFTCAMRDPTPGGSCPYGDGNGVVPNGILLDYSDTACTATGTVTETAYGTWVWVAELEQEGYTIHVPFCASSTAAQPHTATRTYTNAVGTDPIEPLVVDFVPDVNTMVGGSADPVFTVDSGGLCSGSGCSFFGFEFSVTCSPLDPPFSLEPSSRTEDAMMNPTGFTHELSANFPAVSDAFRNRVFSANWSLAYCNADNGAACTDPDLTTNAQSHYNTAVVGWPMRP
jgi:hypothetical protein